MPRARVDSVDVLDVDSVKTERADGFMDTPTWKSKGIDLFDGERLP